MDEPHSHILTIDHIELDARLVGEELFARLVEDCRKDALLVRTRDRLALCDSQCGLVRSRVDRERLAKGVRNIGPQHLRILSALDQVCRLAQKLLAEKSGREFGEIVLHSGRCIQHLAQVENVQREEENFVSANDIDNMILIMPNKVANNLSNPNDPDSASSMQSRSNERKNGKKRKKNPSSKKFTSLIVASLKRLIQMGINLFEGKEQELIQMASKSLST